eukprot:CAMPEP_0202014788 /NCGR_PEP_ID=MMETSP0905-20130828/30129_1 /ASSEMBLY_ACC=CAM_ASM_000554 /TAXON_ID=420261 /ORGANISM="Thalassiosira antarctica, Strain CCMP982" /LENGTH=83 /DNA_ID=CAMNT_0048574787 /DNA_START=54 /DNA_END=306 /DNA_ORIENTATION=+
MAECSSVTNATNLPQSVLDAIYFEVRQVHAQMVQTSPNTKKNGADKTEQNKQQQQKDDEEELALGQNRKKNGIDEKKKQKKKK